MIQNYLLKYQVPGTTDVLGLACLSLTAQRARLPAAGCRLSTYRARRSVAQRKEESQVQGAGSLVPWALSRTGERPSPATSAFPHLVSGTSVVS